VTIKRFVNPVSPLVPGRAYSRKRKGFRPKQESLRPERWPLMSAEHDEALDVLRAVWRGQGQAAADLADEPEGKSCKRMADVGFDEFAAGEPDLTTAWRETLQREGKLRADAGSLRDLVMRPADSR
jgi:hypothetical protein